MPENKGVFIICDCPDGHLSPINRELAGIGRELADEMGAGLSAVLTGDGTNSVAQECIFLGADYVYVIDDPLFSTYITDIYVAALVNLYEQAKPDIVLLGQTSTGRDLGPALAFKLETGITPDCIGLSIDQSTGLLLKTKPVYGGNALAVYVCEEGRPQMAAIRPRTFKPSERNISRKGEVIQFSPQIDGSVLRSRLINRTKDESTGIKLEDADTVICGGKGMGSAEAFKQLEVLADILHGTVGATRLACDANWAKHNCLIGLSGSVITPELYIGIALSGSSQHLAGMQSSKNIVAINKDPGANIFKFSNYGVIAEYEKVLPAFIKKCRELSGRG